MQTLTIAKGGILPVVEVPRSKSYANRVLILAALKGEGFRLEHIPAATDVTMLLAALRQLGLEITEEGPELRFLNRYPGCQSGPQCLQVGEGGTTARFLACLLLESPFTNELILGERLKERPWQEFLELVRGLGGEAELSGNVLRLKGPKRLPPRIEVDCARTTQFASGLRLASALGTTAVVPLNLESSQSYWSMTEALIEDILATNVFRVPMDWSSAAFPMVFAALNQDTFFPGLEHDPLQADAKLLQLLEQLGSVRISGEGIRVSPVRDSRAITLDVSDCLDLVPALSYLLSHLPGTHRVRGVKNLVHKESDRLSEVVQLLRAFDRDTQLKGDELWIEGKVERLLHPVKLALPEDHRMVMAGALFLRHHAGGEVYPAGAVAKSYPGFFDLFRA